VGGGGGGGGRGRGRVRVSNIASTSARVFLVYEPSVKNGPAMCLGPTLRSG